MVKKWTVLLFFFLSISLFLISFILYIVAPEFNQFISWMVGAASLLAFLCVVIFRRPLIQTMRTPYFVNLISNLVTIMLVALIFSLVNYLVFKNDRTMDFTKNKIHTLSQQSRKALRLIKKDQTLILKLFAKRGDWGRYRNLLKLYQNEARDLVEVKFIDVEMEPALAELYQIQVSGTLVVEYGDKKIATEAKDELHVTNALLKVLNPKKIILYYTVGHNEISLRDKNLLGADYLREKILNANFELRPVELRNGIPKDCNALLVLNPQLDFLKEEINEMDLYLKYGGGLILALSPQFNGLMTENLITYIQGLGLTFNNALILDRLAAQQGSQASIPVIKNYNLEHPISKDLQERTLFPVSGFYSFNESDDFSWEIIVKSTPFPASWGEVSFEEVKSGKAVYNEESDFKGPLNIMVAGANDKSRVVAFSSSQFFANQFQGQTPNFNLFLNSLNWTVRDEALISLDRPKLSGDLVYISGIHASLVFYFSVLFFPFIFFIWAIFAYRKKVRM